MEKIIILSGCEGPDEELVAYLGTLFPGCTIEILQREVINLPSAKTPFDGKDSQRLSDTRTKDFAAKYH